MAPTSDPPVISASEQFRKDTREQLRNLWKKKADEPVMKAEFRRIDGKIEDLEEELDKGHLCQKEGDLREMQTSIGTVTRLAEENAKEVKKSYQWSIRILAAMILFLLTTGVGFVWYLAGMSFKIESHDISINRIQSEIDQSKTKPREIEGMIDRAAQRAAESAVRRVSSLNHTEN